MLDVLRELSLHSHAWPYFLLLSLVHRWGNWGSEQFPIFLCCWQSWGRHCSFPGRALNIFPTAPFSFRNSRQALLCLLTLAPLCHFLDPVTLHIPSSFPDLLSAFRTQSGSPDPTLSPRAAQSGHVLFYDPSYIMVWGAYLSLSL